MFAVGVIAFRLLTGTFPFDDKIFDDQPGENVVGHRKMKQIRNRLVNYNIDWSRQVFKDSPDAKDLVQKMLASDEDNRLEASAALQHRWFKSPGPPSSKAGHASPKSQARGA
eukprot:gnl/TRDRNA2_/TRDRNA2_177156_c4_seq1.p1 gnl/TRDRNA2_/TRDRNA2_177156_c4~~gnl/TRDRNA2_/TRDRNA2_177156_c4_seq1.p1  ORF type:complete len:123 (+),score=25.75 gnl/TRDRNA2_/TRDRNA2_177156_c4_seq1:34-369(+)